MYFSQLLDGFVKAVHVFIECCHRTVGLPFEDGAVFNISPISLELGIKHKESLGLQDIPLSSIVDCLVFTCLEGHRWPENSPLWEFSQQCLEIVQLWVKQM